MRWDVQLTPHEQERLLIPVAADVAEKRRARGPTPNPPAAVAPIAAGTAVRFEPGIPVDVELVPISGARIVPGLRGQTGGALDA